MKSHQRGFIPLVAIILLGITAVVGGTIATVSISKSDPKPVVELAPDTARSTSTPALAPVSTSVEALAKDTQNTPAQPKTEGVEQNTKTQSFPTFSKGSLYICEKVKSLESDPNTRSLFQDIQGICEVYEKGGYEIEEIESIEAKLAEKWNLYKKARVEYRSAGFQELDNQNQVSEENKPQPTSNEVTQTETYTESSTYPIVISFTDNFGNLYKGSDYNGYQGPYMYKNKAALKVGDTIKATVEAKDPKGRTLEYNWNSSSQHFNNTVGRGQHSTSNTLTYTLTQEDLQSAGETFRLVYQIRVAGTEYYRFGGGKYDDTGFIDYTLQQ